MSWDAIEPWLVLAAVVGLVMLGRYLAGKKAQRIRMEGRQEARAELRAMMSTGNQHVVVMAGDHDRRAVAFGTADDGASADLELHDRALSGELGRGLHPDHRGLYGYDRDGRAAMVHPVRGGRAADAVGAPPVSPDLRLVRAIGERFQRATLSGDCDGCPVPTDGCPGDCPSRVDGFGYVEDPEAS